MKHMKKIFLGLVVALCAVNVKAVDMMHLMQGGYDAKVMSEHEIDSVLNPNASDRYRLEYENKQQLWRHSFVADCYLVDTQKKTRVKMSEEPVRDAQLSPNGKYVVYAKADNNLYIYKIDFKTEVAITRDTTSEVFNGVADWLYEEEFGVTGLFAFSPDSKMVAFVRLNEEGVPGFEWQEFLQSKKGSEDASLQGGSAYGYPKGYSLRYPRAGEQNAKASVCIYDIHTKYIRSMQLPEEKDSYIPRLRWGVQPAMGKDKTPTMADLMILQMNRDQNEMKVWRGNVKSTVCHPFYTEASSTNYVNYEWFDHWQWLADGRVIVVSEKGGYTQAYLYSAKGMEQKLLTPQKRDVMAVYGWDEKNQVLYYQAAPNALVRHGYAYNMRKGVTTQLTEGEGMHQLTFAKDWTKWVDCYQSNSTPNRYTLHSKGEKRELMNNDSIAALWRASGWQDKEYMRIVTERGDTLNAWQVLPVGFDASKRYPVVMMQYGGPGSQRVTDSWRKRFAHYLSAQGYVVVCADGRGTNARGRAWRNATYMQLGEKEAEDQISVAKYLRGLSYVDGSRIALCGWSYGGYQTIMCMSKQPLVDGKPLWCCGMAIAPVTSWRLYDSAYTERYMRRPQVNEWGYDNSDVMLLAAELKGELLLVHGTADDNVHAQQSWLYVDALVQAGKQFEMQMYPDDNHFLRHGKNYEHLHKRLMIFLEKNMK
jgi:dipeptidyl-peptidase-4